MKPKLLFIEDERDLGHVLSQYIMANDFDVTWCRTADEAYNFYHADTKFNLLMIDVQLPDYDGFELARKILLISPDQPILFLTARSEKDDRLRGLRIGAHDYICKPFDVDELLIRIKNIVRRNEDPAAFNEKKRSLQIGDMLFKRSLLTLRFSTGEEIILTPREAELLEYLHKHQNQTLKREEILVSLWGDADYFLGRSLDVFISRLRKHVGKSNKVRIQNVYGVGYIFRVD